MSNTAEGTHNENHILLDVLKNHLFVNIGDNTLFFIPMSEGDKLNRALYEFCLENKIDASLIEFKNGKG